MHQQIKTRTVLKDNPLMDFELAYSGLAHLTVQRVVRYLSYVVGGADTEIYRNGVVVTPIDLANSVGCYGKLASSLEIYFWGGPPGTEEWFHGSLLTMLIDRLWYHAAKDNENIIADFLKALHGNNRHNSEAAISSSTSSSYSTSYA